MDAKAAPDVLMEQIPLYAQALIVGVSSPSRPKGSGRYTVVHNTSTSVA